MTWQAILDDQNRVVTVNYWEHSVGIPCEVDTPLGCLWDGSEFVEAQEVIRAAAKEARASAVAAIKVTTSTGKVFDGDETSQTRMSRAVVGMQAVGATTINWVLADNTPVQVTADELAEALVLAGQAQANIWVL